MIHFTLLTITNCKLNLYSSKAENGTIFEEFSILNFRALNIRESHERPEAVEETSVVVTGLKLKEFYQGIKIKNQNTGNKRNINLVSDYSRYLYNEIERIILSHIDWKQRSLAKRMLNLYKSFLSRTFFYF